MSAVRKSARVMLGALILALGAGLSSVVAQTPAPRPAAPAAQAPRPAAPAAHATPGTPTPNAVALAGELLALKGGSQMFGGMVDGVIESAKDQFLPNNPTLNRPLTEVAAQLRKDFESKKTELMQEVARVYARRFTEQELRELLAFYKTNLGRKVLSDEAPAVEDSFKRAQEWTNDFSDQVLTKMRAEMRKKGFEL
jgi:hypothetical protein